MIHHGDKLYLTYSASDTGVAYCVGMLTATSGTDLLDPLNWRKERSSGYYKAVMKKGIYGRDIIVLPKMKMEMISWYTMHAQKQR